MFSLLIRYAVARVHEISACIIYWIHIMAKNYNNTQEDQIPRRTDIPRREHMLRFIGGFGRPKMGGFP